MSKKGEKKGVGTKKLYEHGTDNGRGWMGGISLGTYSCAADVYMYLSTKLGRKKLGAHQPAFVPARKRIMCSQERNLFEATLIGIRFVRRLRRPYCSGNNKLNKICERQKLVKACIVFFIGHPLLPRANQTGKTSLEWDRSK